MTDSNPSDRGEDKMKKGGYIYIMTNQRLNTMYIGVTNNLARRIWEHKKHHNKYSFTDRYNLEYCIYYEFFTDIETAIKRETQLKKWSRAKKETLIDKLNPDRNDLWGDIKDWR